VTDDQCGVPEREMEVTDQPRCAAARQIRLPAGVVRDLELVGTSKVSFTGTHTKKSIAAADYELLLCCCRHCHVWWWCNCDLQHVKCESLDAWSADVTPRRVGSRRAEQGCGDLGGGGLRP